MRALISCLFSAAVILPVSTAVIAEEGAERDPMAELKEKVVNEVMKMVEARLAQQGGDAERPRSLGKTLTLDFKVTPGDKDSVMSLNCATQRFRVSMHVGNDERGADFEVSGSLCLLENGTKLLVTYEANAEYTGEGAERGFEAEGGVLVKIGETATLAKLGDQTVTVTVKDADKKEF
jgi:hypothetical protein